MSRKGRKINNAKIAKSTTLMPNLAYFARRTLRPLREPEFILQDYHTPMPQIGVYFLLAVVDL